MSPYVAKSSVFATISGVTQNQAVARCKILLQKDAMKIGYARVSSDDQNLALQRDALAGAGCDKVFEDQGVSGSVERRAGLDQALAAMQSGDVLVTWRLDRLGRSLPHLIDLVAGLNARGCEFQSLTESIDTTSAGGKLVFHIMGALAEFERSLIIERTKAGVAAARKRGQVLGRRRKLNEAQIAHAREAIEAGRESVASMARLLGVERSTLWRALNR